MITWIAFTRPGIGQSKCLPGRHQPSWSSTSRAPPCASCRRAPRPANRHERKGLAMREETVARVHGLCACTAAGLHNLLDHQIGLDGRSRAQMNSLVGQIRVQGVPVREGEDRHRLDALAACRLDDAASKLAAIGDRILSNTIVVRRCCCCGAAEASSTGVRPPSESRSISPKRRWIA
jgi:hypothetical protein